MLCGTALFSRKKSSLCVLFLFFLTFNNNHEDTTFHTELWIRYLRCSVEARDCQLFSSPINNFETKKKQTNDYRNQFDSRRARELRRARCERDRNKTFSVFELLLTYQRVQMFPFFTNVFVCLQTNEWQCKQNDNKQQPCYSYFQKLVLFWTFFDNFSFFWQPNLTFDVDSKKSNVG